MAWQEASCWLSAKGGEPGEDMLARSCSDSGDNFGARSIASTDTEVDGLKDIDALGKSNSAHTNRRTDAVKCILIKQRNVEAIS